MTSKTGIIFIFFFWLSPNVFFGQEILQDSLSVNITALSEKIAVTSISRKEFRTMSASFDDPSRLLTKYAGFANSNDQANDIVYEGLPPHFTKWSLYGAEILNPNHLSNAGTTSDTPTRSAGGVNAFSGQILGDFSYLGQPNTASFNALAGMANMRLRTPYKNTQRIQLSLIGLEIGFDQALNKGKSHWLQGNYRYSTIGLLSELGVDLGDEEIRYQDMSLNYYYRVYENLDVVGYFNYGKSSNEKDTVDQFGEYQLKKDFFEIDYFSNNVNTGINANYKVKSFGLNTTVNYSKREDDYSSVYSKVANSANFFSGEHFEYLQEELISWNTQIEKKNDSFTIGLGFNSLWNYYDVKINPDDFMTQYSYSVIQKNKYHTYVPSVFYKQKLFSRISFGTNIKLQYTNRLNDQYDNRKEDWMILPSAHIRFQTSGNSNLHLEYTTSTQVASPQQLAYRESPDLYPIQSLASTAEHYSLNFKYQAGHQFGIKLYYHTLNNLIAFEESTLASGLNGTTPILGKPNTTGNQAQIFGVSLSEKATLFKHHLSGNLNLFDGSQTINNVKHETYRYEYNFMASFSISRTLELNAKRRLGYHVSYISRGGQYGSQFQGTLPFEYQRGYLNDRLGSYHRVDFRIFLDTKKKSFKHRVSLDIQNVLNRRNDGFLDYNVANYDLIVRKQLGIIPVLSWSIEI